MSKHQLRAELVNLRHLAALSKHQLRAEPGNLGHLAELVDALNYQAQLLIALRYE